MGVPGVSVGEVDAPSAGVFVPAMGNDAQAQGVELMCVGTELTSSVRYEARWREVIARVRSVYEGPLTYAANWHDEYLDIKFWDALDYAGLDPYFPLSDKEVAWQLDFLRQL